MSGRYSGLCSRRSCARGGDPRWRVVEVVEHSYSPPRSHDYMPDHRGSICRETSVALQSHPCYTVRPFSILPPVAKRISTDWVLLPEGLSVRGWLDCWSQRTRHR